MMTKFTIESKQNLWKKRKYVTLFASNKYKIEGLIETESENKNVRYRKRNLPGLRREYS